YPYLTISDLAALTGRSYPAIAARTNKLKRKPNELIKIAPAQLDHARMYQWVAQALQLAPAGVAKLNDIGFEACGPRPSIHFIHQLTQSQTAASFEVGARLAGLKLHRLPEMPIGVSFTHKDKTYANHKLTPDGGPIGLGYPDGTYSFV